MMKMVLHEIAGHSAQRFLYGSDLSDDVSAVAVLLHHFLQAADLTFDQLRELGEFANGYGLRKFRLNDAKTELSFEYDASRLRETEVQHVLGQAKIAVAKRLN